jgi:PucR C-terminal helix-turn-helix domain
MKRLLRQAQVTDAGSAEMLKVIDQFDQLTASQASLSKLVRFAHKLTGRGIGVDESWNGRMVLMSSDGNEMCDDTSLARLSATLEAAVASRLRGRRSRIIEVDNSEVLVANLEAASGRIGLVWLEHDAKPWTLKDHVVAERLAAAVVTDAITTNARASHSSSVDAAALERLLAGGLSVTEAAIAGRQVQLRPDQKYVVLAIAENPRSATSSSVLAEFIRRELERGGVSARPTVVGSLAAVVAESNVRIIELLEAALAAPLGPGGALSIGVGAPANLVRLGESWREAQETLVLRSLAASDRRIARFEELGLLHLLAQIPQAEVEKFSDYQRVATLSERGASPNDLELLNAFCDSGSLRGTAKTTFMHFTTVRYRLTRIGEAIGLDLSDASDLLRAHVAVKLVQVHRARILDDWNRT